jgi:hypothetical protein
MYFFTFLRHGESRVRCEGHNNSETSLFTEPDFFKTLKIFIKILGSKNFVASWSKYFYFFLIGGMLDEIFLYKKIEMYNDKIMKLTLKQIKY